MRGFPFTLLQGVWVIVPLATVLVVACEEQETPPQTEDLRVEPAIDDPAVEEAHADPAPPSAATDENPAEPTHAGPELATGVVVSSDPEQGLTFSVLHRLASAIGLPRPTIHGRPKEVGTGRHVVLVSFADADDRGGREGALRPEIWLIDRQSDGQTRRLGALPIAHVPVTDYLALSVGEVAEQAGELFRVRSTRAGDLDNDGKSELELVVEVDDDVVCGPGLLTHRWYMIFNCEPELRLAADLPLVEASGSGAHNRGTARLVDHDGDGHPDIDLRTKTCTEGDYGDEEGCRREETHHAFFLWEEGTDRWSRSPTTPDPCPEE